MQRIPVQERSSLESTAREHGYDFDGDGVPYWDETAYYRFTLAQIEEQIEKPALEIDAMCFQLLDRSLSDEAVFRRLGIPEIYWDYVAQSWRSREKDLYGRMDFSYDGAGSVKLLEYNADTPTTLYESAVFQWIWLEEAIAEGLVRKDCDQFAELHEDLVQAFAAMDDGGIIHFGCVIDAEDDKDTVDYLEECALEAGVTTQFLAMRDIGVDAMGRFSDLEDRVIERLF
ncbi:MAG: glutathionylspermidine synthase family protein, partial [Rhodospirillales bacterium]|nr:glutathionylspermidine synthase family protein [Rhodospirillales bacterium]